MSILINKDTKILVQGMTGKTGTFHTEQALAYHGTQDGRRHHTRRRAARPGKAADGEKLPIFNTVAEGKEATGANASVIYVPPAGAARAIIEAIEAGDPADRLHHRRHSGCSTWSGSRPGSTSRSRA